MLTAVAERKRPVGRKNPRLTIEVYDQDVDLAHRFRMAAVAARVTLREWLLEAGRQRLEREAADAAHASES